MDELIWLFLVYWWKLQKGVRYQQMHAQGESSFLFFRIFVTNVQSLASNIITAFKCQCKISARPKSVLFEG